MSANGARVGTTAAALRSLFDESFCVAAVPNTQRLERLLAIRVGGDPYVLCLSQIAGLYADRKIVAVASPVSQLLGIAGLRGMMVPVYDLAALLAYPPAVNPRWMVVAAGPEPVGIAFESFETHVQVARASLTIEDEQATGAATTRRHVRGSIHVADALHPIVHIDSVVETLRKN